MNLLTVGISDCQVSRDPEAALMTYALGSCIAVTVFDPVSKVAGLLHYMLPEAGLDLERARAKPFMFADTGVPILFRNAYELGAVKQRIIVTAIGGAQVLATNNTFNIGKRNHLALRKILWKAGVMLHHEEVGGTIPRNVRIQVGNGVVTISYGRQEHDLNSPSVPQGGKFQHGI